MMSEKGTAGKWKLSCYFFLVMVCSLWVAVWGYTSDLNASSVDSVSAAKEKIENRFPILEKDPLRDFNDYAVHLLDLYTPKMRYPHLSVSMRADDSPTIEMHQIAVDVAALAYFMVEKKLWLPQSEKFLPFLDLTVESMFEREFSNALEQDGRREDEKLTFDYNKTIKDFPVIFYFSQHRVKSIPILLDEFQRKKRFDVSTDILKMANIERRLRCVSLIAAILLSESGYPMKDPTPEITPEIWHRIAGEMWRDVSRRMMDDDEKFHEATTVAFNSRMPFYFSIWAYPPDPVKYPMVERNEEEHERIMKYVPALQP